MPAIGLGSRDLFEYNERHGVLICRECQYAIQKSALSSHLLRHKIYRGERQRLLSSIAQLKLLEPHQVRLPTPFSSPIDALPIISGYRCTVARCGKLCASSKRMARHWSEIHGLSEPAPHVDSSSFARPVKLQTFFRGTKLRYFEVASSPVAGTAGAAPLVTMVTTTTDDEDQRHDEQGHDTVTTKAPSSPLRVPGTPLRTSSAGIDLETLTYFHQFSTTTSLTLPGAQHLRPASQYWQTEVVLQALQRRWLMCGLLAISACHLAALADDTTIKRVHYDRFAQFFSEFSAGWDEIKERDVGVVAAVAEEEAKKSGGQVMCILRCAHWALAEPTFDQEISLELETPFQLKSIMTTIGGVVLPEFALRLVSIRSDEYQDETFAQTRRILDMRNSSDARSSDAFSPSNIKPSVLINCLRALPYRMAEVFGKPESARDVLATLSAIASLVECCDISSGSDEMGAVWRGMATWLTTVPDHFNHMVSCHNPAALVVVAHWGALVFQAEHCGCWFLRGMAKKILLQITERLPAANRAVHSMVKSLMA